MRKLNLSASLASKSPRAQDLYKLRARLNLTQPEMATVMGCSKAGYQRFELDERAVPDYIARLCCAMNLLSAKALAEFVALAEAK